MAEGSAFDELVSTVDYPMTIVTAADGNERAGCLVGFSAQCSIDPPRYCVLLSRVNHTFTVAERSTVLVVHVLREGDRSIARLFGEETGDTADKFDRCAWTAGPDGVPVLAGLDWFAGPILGRFDGGDHVGHVLDPSAGGTSARRGEPQLGFQSARGLSAAHPA